MALFNENGVICKDLDKVGFQAEQALRTFIQEAIRLGATQTELRALGMVLAQTVLCAITDEIILMTSRNRKKLSSGQRPA